MSIRLKYKYGTFIHKSSEAFPRWNTVRRPVIPIHLIHGSLSVGLLALIDSGADVSVVSASIGEQIGINVEAGKAFSFCGLSKNADSLTAYRHDIKIDIGGHQFDYTFGFVRGVPNLSYAILGHIDFFKLFIVSFDFQKQTIELINR